MCTCKWYVGGMCMHVGGVCGWRVRACGWYIGVCACKWRVCMHVGAYVHVGLQSFSVIQSITRS